VLTYYLPKEKVRKVKNLLSNKEGEQDPEPEPVQIDEIVSNWHRVRAFDANRNCGLVTPFQNLTLALVSDSDKLSITKMPPPVAQRTFWCPCCLEALIEPTPWIEFRYTPGPWCIGSDSNHGSLLSHRLSERVLAAPVAIHRN